VSKPNFLAISYYTPEYEMFAVRLKANLDRIKVPNDIRQKPSRGSWQSNCAYKPQYIEDMRAEHKATPLLWIDADATLTKFPEHINDLASNPDLDISVRTSNTDPPHPWNRIMSGTVYFGITKRSAYLLKRWNEICTMNPRRWDQVSLAIAIEQGYKDGSAYILEPLPETYCAVCNKRQSDEQPVIIHWQASRTMKDKVGDAGDSE